MMYILIFFQRLSCLITSELRMQVKLLSRYIEISELRKEKNLMCRICEDCPHPIPLPAGEGIISPSPNGRGAGRGYIFPILPMNLFIFSYTLYKLTIFICTIITKNATLEITMILH